MDKTKKDRMSTDTYKKVFMKIWEENLTECSVETIAGYVGVSAAAVYKWAYAESKVNPIYELVRDGVIYKAGRNYRLVDPIAQPNPDDGFYEKNSEEVPRLGQLEEMKGELDFKVDILAAVDALVAFHIKKSKTSLIDKIKNKFL